jgi:uncharacterized protein (DUF1015 family)
MRIRPYRALRPRPELAEKVTAVPYDVVSTAEAAALAASNPLSFLHVSRSEIDLPEGTDPYAPSVYAKARENFLRLRKDGVFVQEDAPCLYVYRLAQKDHVQRGVVACCSIEDYRRNIIRKHENTRPDKEEDRTRHLRELNAQPGLVLMAYRDTPEIDERVAAAEKTRPLYDFTASDGVRHTVWRVTEVQPLTTAFEKVPAAYIADGHHRAAAAVRIGNERRRAGPHLAGDAEWEWFVGVLFPASQLQILPYNRCVKDLNGMTPDAFLMSVASRLALSEDTHGHPSCPSRVRMYLGSKWYGLGWEPDSQADPVAALDVSILQDRLLAPILGIDDPRTSGRIDFVGGARGIEELVRLVDTRCMAVAFAMCPVTIAQLMAIADANRIMPPKSTWFEPKLRSGFLIHML